MQFLHALDEQKELTYDDVFLVPRFTEIVSRMKVDLMPTDVTNATLPIVVANMTAIAGKRMAETVTRRGGLVVLPQDMSMTRIEEAAHYLKSCHSVFETPVVLFENQTIQEALDLIHKRAHGAVMVVNQDRKPVGIFTERDAIQHDRFTHLSEVMSKDMISMPDVATPEQIFSAIKSRRVSVMPIIGKDGSLAGLLTSKGTLRATVYRPAINQNREFVTAVAIGINQDAEQKSRALLSLGVDLLILDTANGHQRRMLETIRTVRAILGPHRPLIAGNVVTAEATRDFIEAGATIVKVGVGPGAMCTTRMMTGMGRPQFSAVIACAREARNRGAHVWADGNIKHARDVALALAAGASSVMIGSWFAGTYESAADTHRDENGRLYKENFGMASGRAVTNRTRTEDPFTIAQKQFFEEGISVGKMYLKSGEESAEDIIDKISAGVRSACAYAGAANLNEFYQNAVVGVQTNAGFAEGKAWAQDW